MDIENHNEEYENFKKLCPNAKEIINEIGIKSLIVEKDGEIVFRLDYIKSGELSERDVLIVKNWYSLPKNLEEIVEAYNVLMKEPIDSKFHYNCTVDRLDYMKELIEEFQELNPDVLIKGEWLRTKEQKNQGLTITCSKPLENLERPQGYFGTALNLIVFPITSEDYKNNLSGELLNFDLTHDSKAFREFFELLQLLNSKVQLHVIIDSETNVPKIVPSPILNRLKTPGRFNSNIGYDKDGYVGSLVDKIYTFAKDENGEFEESVNPYINASIFREQTKNKQVETKSLTKKKTL